MPKLDSWSVRYDRSLSLMTTRQDIYDRIRHSSRDEEILEEMIRLGFWPRSSGLPEDPADEIRRIGELERTLHVLTAEDNQLRDAENARRALEQKRRAESRRQCQETKQRKLRARALRAEAWQARKQREILHLGEGVSAGLNDHQLDAQRLQAQGLPLIHDPSQLADLMGLNLGQLRFLAYARRVSRTTHYRRYLLPKKTGGHRLISAPMPRLKAAQSWILRTILDPVPAHDAAHGFRSGRSIVSNAEPHVGAEVVVNLDLKDFFPTITYRRIKGVFVKLGYGESVATVLALLCSEPEVATVTCDGTTYHVARSERHLPQGAPTSPALTNILCRNLDARLTRTAEALGFRYTRYADDLSFSGSGPADKAVGPLLRRARHIIQGEGFIVHPDKTRVLRRGRRQEVTGLVVNDSVGIKRADLRRFRALLHQIERDGPAGKHWKGNPNVLQAIDGFANFVAMVDPDRGAELRRRAQAIRRRWA